MSLTLEERETIIVFNEADKTAIVDTCNNFLIRRCEHAQSKCPNDVRLISKDQFGKRFKLPKTFIKINPPKKMNLTDEQKQTISKRFSKANK